MEDDRSGAAEKGSPGVGRGADHSDEPPGETGGSPAEGGGESVFRRLQELAEYVSYYAQVRSDSLRAGVRRALWKCVADGLWLILVVVAIVCGAIYAAVGLAGGLRAFFPDQLWLGDLGAGLALLAAAGLIVWARMARARKIAFDKTVRKYEQRKSRQREQFGRTVADRAKDVAPKG